MTEKPLKLVSWGKDEFENTYGFINKVSDFKKEVREKYAAPLAATKSIFKKWKIHFIILIEIRSRVAHISSANEPSFIF